MHVRTDQVVQFVQDSVNDFDEQVSLLVLQRGAHQQRQDLVEERPRAEVASLVRDLSEGGLAHGRSSVLKSCINISNSAS